ncbi:hypothetical protein CEV33_1042 [Brucella grignonensis]|uniref:Uncharacterized protein n=2 Tax=Brucella grignonensis TaxID=94627 RepID=A0A256FEL4_9HYPH|nr:hypothetical protein CEV33_1042 [Brucella grignonensis]
MKLERHLADRDASFAAYRQASDREQSARAEYGLVGGFAASRLKAHPGSQTTYPGAPDPKPTATTQERISAPVEAAKRALQVASAARERAGEHQDKFAFLENILEWLRRTAAPGGHFREARIDPALVKTKGPLATEVTKIRARIAEIEATFAKVERAPVPADDLRSRAFAEIDRIAETGVLKVHPSNRTGTPLGLAQKLSIALVGENSLIGTGGSEVLVWLLRDDLKGAVAAMINALPQAGAMSDDERETAFADLAAARLKLERIEECLIATAAVDGLAIARRFDLDPRAYLNIEA